MSRVVMLLVVIAGCGKKHDTPEVVDQNIDVERLRDPSVVPGPMPPAKDGPTVKTDAEAMALDNAVMKQMVDIYVADGSDCDKLASDLMMIVTDPKYAALNAYFEAHPSFTHEPEGSAKFKEAAARVRDRCALNKRYLNVLMSF